MLLIMFIKKENPCKAICISILIIGLVYMYYFKKDTGAILRFGDFYTKVALVVDYGFTPVFPFLFNKLISCILTTV